MGSTVEGEWVTAGEAAARLRVHRRSINNYIRAGILDSRTTEAGRLMVSEESLSRAEARERGELPDEPPEPEGRELSRAVADSLRSSEARIEGLTRLLLSALQWQVEDARKAQTLLLEGLQTAQRTALEAVVARNVAEDGALARQVTLQQVVSQEERKNALASWAFENLPKMIAGGKARAELAGLVRSITPDQLALLEAVVTPTQAEAIRALQGLLSAEDAAMKGQQA